MNIDLCVFLTKRLYIEGVVRPDRWRQAASAFQKQPRQSRSHCELLTMTSRLASVVAQKSFIIITKSLHK